MTVVNASRSAVMVELQLRGHAKTVGADGETCRVTIERAELAIPTSLLASLRGSPDPASPITATTDEVAILEVEPGATDTEVVTFQLSEADPLTDADLIEKLAGLDDDDEMLVVLGAAGQDEPIVEAVEAPVPAPQPD